MPASRLPVRSIKSPENNIAGPSTSPARTLSHVESGCRRSSGPEDCIQVGGYVENRGKALFQLAREKGLEGIIAKRKANTYQPSRRSPDWLKIKSRPQQEFVVCGFTEGKGSRKHFGALLLGAYRNGRLRFSSFLVKNDNSSGVTSCSVSPTYF
jgi:ATP-dependent DNA ligase